MTGGFFVIMSTEQSNNLSQEKFQTLKNGEWATRFSLRERVFSPDLIRQGESFIGKWNAVWNKIFPTENTWIRKNHGIPSLIVRLDCTVQNGELKLYEVEERPAGIGVTRQVNPQFKEKLASISKTWPGFKSVVSPLRRGSDDSSWRETIDLETAAKNKELVLVRAEPAETEFHTLAGQSVSTIQHKGDKQYGEKMGLWSPVSSIDQLDWGQAFVLKPRKGSKTQEVFFWHPTERRLQGLSTKTKIMNILSGQPEGMYLQPYHPPMESEIPDASHMIYRVFYGYNIQKKKWECLGGVWNARPNVKVHGAGDTIFGPVVV